MKGDFMFFKDKREKELSKREKEIEIKLEQIIKEKEALQKEKEQLLKIKEMMENTNYVDTIDISNVYVWRKGDVCYFVELKEEKITKKIHQELELSSYNQTLTDIFSKKIIYETSNKIERFFEIEELGVVYRTYLTPICEREHNLLIYADKKVPKYVLLQLYYNLNGIDLTEPTLKK